MVALLLSTPVEIAIHFLKEWLEELNIAKIKINELTKLTKLCTSQNFF